MCGGSAAPGVCGGSAAPGVCGGSADLENLTVNIEHVLHLQIFGPLPRFYIYITTTQFIRVKSLYLVSFEEN